MSLERRRCARRGLRLIFFAFGLDEFMTVIREFMRNLQVDSTMVEHLESGSTVLVTNELPLTLIVAPSYAWWMHLRKAHEAHCERRSGRLAADPASYLA